MASKVPDSADVLLHLATCFMDTNPAGLKALRLLLETMEPRVLQVYVTNLKLLIAKYPLFNSRVNDKAYVQTMTILNELLKESCYKAKKAHETTQ